MDFQSFVLISFCVGVRTEEVPSPFYTIWWQKSSMAVANFHLAQPFIAAQAHGCLCSWRPHCERDRKEPEQ